MNYKLASCRRKADIRTEDNFESGFYKAVNKALYCTFEYYKIYKYHKETQSKHLILLCAFICV